MLRNLLTGLTIVIGAVSLTASPITPDEALGRLQGSGHKMASAARQGKTLKLVHTAVTDKGNPAAYIFNRENGGGYLVVSGDDAAYPLLGYSDNGNVEGDNISPELQWWLGEYARQIQYAAEKGVKASAVKMSSTRADMAPIAPMLKSRWDQGAPYYNQCPLVGNVRTYTGCVATAMAQVMNYWQYPEKGSGYISYECEDISKRLDLDFSKRGFDWKNTLNEYVPGKYNDAQADAVAYLMKACGYAVKMGYGTDASGALAMNIASGLKKYFGYDPNITYTLRSYYSATEWNKLMYDNLKDVGPVVYGGGSLIGGGHSFVLDGYDGNGLFHFNWGWSGTSDGYFSLDAINPESLGTGGGGGGGYNFTQDAVLGIQPPTGKPAVESPLVINQTGSLAATVEEGKILFDLFAEDGAMWVNYNPTTMKVKFGAEFALQGGAAEPVYADVSEKKFAIKAGYGTNPYYLQPSVDLASLNLADGTYKVTFCAIELEKEDVEWHPVRHNYGHVNYVTLTKKGNVYKVVNEDVARIEVVKGEIANTLYNGGVAKVRITVRNDWDYELTGGFAPALLYTIEGQSVCTHLGESVMITVPPHSEIEKEWTTSIYAMQGAPSVADDTEFKLTFFDEGTYNFYTDDISDPIVMKANPGLPKIASAGPPMITNATLQKVETNNGPLNVYKVNDPSEIKVFSSVRLTSGIFCYDMMAAILRPSDTEEGMMEILTYQGYPMFMEQEGMMQKFSTTLSYPSAQPGTIYYLVLAYGYGGSLVPCDNNTSYFIVGSSDVAGLEADNARITMQGKTLRAAGLIEVYNLQGMKMAEGMDSLSVESLPKGIYVAQAGGKTLKFAL